MTEQHKPRPYEAVILLHPDSTPEEQKELFKKNKGIIEGGKGTIHTIDTWGKRSLANQINRLKKAVYFHTTFESDPAVIAELERTMRINDKVLRFMHTRLDERLTIEKHNERFKEGLKETAQREKEREAKFQARRAARTDR